MTGAGGASPASPGSASSGSRSASGRRSYGRGAILFLRSEDFFADPVGAVGRVTGFLGLRPHPGPLPPAKNVASYDTMKPETRSRLREVFAEPNRRLEEHLGRELGWQKPGDP